MDWSKVPDMDPEDAWNKVTQADMDRDLDDLREVRNLTLGESQSDVLWSLKRSQAIKIYVKALPTTSYFELESAFRHQDFNTYLIASVSYQ